MRLFHGVAFISECGLGDGIKIKSISTKNLRGKDVVIPQQYHDFILKKFNKWATDYEMTHNMYCSIGVPIYKLDKVMFTVAMNEYAMVLALQHPSDVQNKKKAVKIVTGKLERATNGKSYENEYGELPKWLIYL